MDGREYEAIEQNPEKPSRWGQLAREGHQVVQFKDNETNSFVAVAVDGKVREYGSFRRDFPNLSLCKLRGLQGSPFFLTTTDSV